MCNNKSKKKMISTKWLEVCKKRPRPSCVVIRYFSFALLDGRDNRHIGFTLIYGCPWHKLFSTIYQGLKKYHLSTYLLIYQIIKYSIATNSRLSTFGRYLRSREKCHMANSRTYYRRHSMGCIMYVHVNFELKS